MNFGSQNTVFEEHFGARRREKRCFSSKKKLRVLKKQVFCDSESFTLIETLVAVTILVTAIMGPMAIAISAINYAKFTKNQITATYLAQEGVEFARNLRNENFLQGGNWINGNNLNNCQGPDGCYVDVLSSINPVNDVRRCSGTCPAISYNTVSGYYTYSGLNLISTPFVRTIKIDKLPGNEEAKVEVVVTWQESFGLKSFTMQENLFDWRK